MSGINSNHAQTMCGKSEWAEWDKLKFYTFLDVWNKSCKISSLFAIAGELSDYGFWFSRCNSFFYLTWPLAKTEILYCNNLKPYALTKVHLKRNTEAVELIVNPNRPGLRTRKWVRISFMSGQCYLIHLVYCIMCEQTSFYLDVLLMWYYIF